MADRIRVFGGDLESAGYSDDDDALLGNAGRNQLAAMEPLDFTEPLRWGHRPSFKNLVVFLLRRVQNSHFRTKLLRRICWLIVGYLCLV